MTGVDLDEGERVVCAEALAAEAYTILNRATSASDKADLHQRYSRAARLLERAAMLTQAEPIAAKATLSQLTAGWR